MTETKTPAVRRLQFAGAGFVITGLLLLLGVLVPVRAEATKPDPEHQVTLCHRTDSDTNPYNKITVDVASVFSEGHDGHDGVVFYEAIPKHEQWGDIIPAFDYGPGQQYGGKNLTDGQAWLDNGCNPPPATTTSAPTTTSTVPTTTTTTEPATTTTEPATTTTTAPGTTTSSAPASTTSSLPGTTTTTVPGTTTSTGIVTTTSGAVTTTTAPAQVLAEDTSRSALPVTGTDALLLGAFGAALLVGGIVLLVLAQRRSGAGTPTEQS